MVTYFAERLIQDVNGHAPSARVYFHGAEVAHATIEVVRTCPFPLANITSCASGATIAELSLPFMGAERVWMEWLLAEFPSLEVLIEWYLPATPLYAIGRSHEGLFLWTTVHDPWTSSPEDLGVPLLLRDVVRDRLRIFREGLSAVAR